MTEAGAQHHGKRDRAESARGASEDLEANLHERRGGQDRVFGKAILPRGARYSRFGR